MKNTLILALCVICTTLYGCADLFNLALSERQLRENEKEVIYITASEIYPRSIYISLKELRSRSLYKLFVVTMQGDTINKDHFYYDDLAMPSLIKFNNQGKRLLPNASDPRSFQFVWISSLLEPIDSYGGLEVSLYDGRSSLIKKKILNP